jgi:hypothetical protein
MVVKPLIALFVHHPECSTQCCDGIINALKSDYDFKLFSEKDLNEDTLKGVDIVAFPGGIGEADSHHKFFRRRASNLIANFVEQGGRYLGICMGAYWAEELYFDILDDVRAVQYIKRPTADIKRSYGTVAPVLWNNTPMNMYFYDGCTFVGDNTKFKTVAMYANGEPMAIVQGRIGLIGCHPESMKFWYEKPWQYINKHWHHGYHHKLLLEFVNELMKT